MSCRLWRSAPRRREPLASLLPPLGEGCGWGLGLWRRAPAMPPTPSLPGGRREQARGRHRPSRLHRMLHRVQQVAAGHRIRRRGYVGGASLRHHLAATLARAGTDVDDVVGAPDRLFVVLHDHQRVALLAELVQGIEQDPVVARMQSDRRLVEHVAHALQVGAQLRGQPDALRFAARQRRRAAVQREVAQADFLEELEAAADLGNQVARDPLFAHAQRAFHLQGLDPAPHVDHRQRGNLVDAGLIEPHVARLQVQPGAVAGGAGLVADVFHLRLGEGLFASLVVVGLQGVVQRLALLAREPDAGAHAFGAPAVLAVVREQARIEFGITGAADRTGPPGRKHFDGADVLVRSKPCHHGATQAVQRRQHMQHALAVFQRLGDLATQQRLVGRREVEVAHRQLDGVFLESVDARKARGRQEIAVHAQVRVAARTRPVREFRVHALAVDHQRRQQSDVLGSIALHQLGHDAVGRLRAHFGAVVDAVLHAQLHVQQAQEMPELGGGADRRLAAAARQALLDRHRGRNPVHRVDLGPAGRLHDAACVGIERFQVAALAFVEQDVEGERRFARTRDAGDDTELVVRNVDRQRLQVVFAGVDDLDGIGTRGEGPLPQGEGVRGIALGSSTNPHPTSCRSRAVPWPCANSHAV